jgi:hypothetical protein
MSGVVKIEIRETEEELKASSEERERRSPPRKTASSVLAQNPNGRQRIVCCCALGKHRTTIQRWLSSYRSGGIEELLLQKPRSGRPRIMNPETVERLSKELQEPEGFSSYKEVHQWLTSCCEVKVAYRTVHQWARYRLKEN